MKKLIPSILCVCILLSNAITVGAQNFENSGIVSTESIIEDGIITPFALYTSSTDTRLSVSSSGQATCTASLTGYSVTTTKVVIYMYLQRLENGSWVTIKSWPSQTFNTYKGTKQETYDVSKGYSYRVYASYYAYSGSKSENIPGYSSTVKY